MAVAAAVAMRTLQARHPGCPHPARMGGPQLLLLRQPDQKLGLTGQEMAP